MMNLLNMLHTLPWKIIRFQSLILGNVFSSKFSFYLLESINPIFSAFIVSNAFNNQVRQTFYIFDYLSDIAPRLS